MILFSLFYLIERPEWPLWHHKETFYPLLLQCVARLLIVPEPSNWCHCDIPMPWLSLATAALDLEKISIIPCSSLDGKTTSTMQTFQLQMFRALKCGKIIYKVIAVILIWLLLWQWIRPCSAISLLRFLPFMNAGITLLILHLLFLFSIFHFAVSCHFCFVFVLLQLVSLYAFFSWFLRRKRQNTV